jgi:hypothetical protein
MLGGRRFVAALVVVTALLALLGSGAGGAGPRPAEASGPESTTSLVDLVDRGGEATGVLVARPPSSADAGLARWVGSTRTLLVALAVVGAVAGPAASVVAGWWGLQRRDRRFRVPLRCSSLAALRAPPAL